MDPKSTSRAKASTANQSKKGPIDGPGGEVQFPRANPGDVPFVRPIARTPSVQTNK